MTISRSRKFTPETLITAPRRSAAVPNQDGSLALYTTSKYSLDSHSVTKEIRVLDLKTGLTTLFSDDSENEEPHWLVDYKILWLRKGSGGTTQIWIGTGGDVEKDAYLAYTIPAPMSGFKVKPLEGNVIALAGVAKAAPDGTLYNPEKADKPLSSAREYGTIMTRFWDTYLTPEKNAIWHTTLTVAGNGRFSVSEKGFTNALKDTDFESPFPNPFGEDSAWDISTSGILFTAQDPADDPAKVLRERLYYIRFDVDDDRPAQKPYEIVVPGFFGNASGPIFSPDGRSAAFLKQKKLEEWYDNTNIFIIRKVDDPSIIFEVDTTNESHEEWDLSPSELLWSNDGKQLYIVAADQGRSRVFSVPSTAHSASNSDSTPRPVTNDGGSISGIYPLTQASSDTKFLITKSSFIDSSFYTVVDTTDRTSSLISSATKNGSVFGLHASQVSEIRFKGAGDYEVQAWVMVPSDFDPEKTYPVAFVLHGGPVSNWKESWSTRWNLAVFAEQGYVVIACNPTGSTGFGHDLTHGIRGQWGGRPYIDLVRCFEYVKKEMDFVDTDRAVALGASYGGYMINWIAGQPLAKEFKALVCHDGIFSLYMLQGCDVSTGLDQDFGGYLWENKAGYDRWDPAQHTHNWTTPMLVIHSDRDYRCNLAEGFAVFAICQQRGIESRMLNFPSESHFVLDHEASFFWHKSVLGWINKYAGVTDGVQLADPVSERRRHARDS